MLLTSVGLVIGLDGSLLLMPVLQSFLIDLPASDSVTLPLGPTSSRSCDHGA